MVEEAVRLEGPEDVDISLPQLLAPPSRSLFRRLRAALRRMFGALRIRDQRLEDVVTEQPVIVGKNGFVRGNIVAPTVVVSGLVYGSILAGEVRVRRGGQVWGDVVAARLTVEPRSVLHGWYSTPDKASLKALSTGEPLSVELAEQLQVAMPPGEEEWQRRPLPEQLRLLQLQAGLAIAERTELEGRFEERVTEVAGEALARAREVLAQADSMQEELNSAHVALEEAEQALEGKAEETARLEQGVAELQTQLAEHVAELDELRALYQEKSDQLAEMQAAKAVMQSELQEYLLRFDDVKGSATNLEGALQASLQRAMEQEEALGRWQELAEVTGQREAQLQQAFDEAQAKLTAKQELVESLRLEQAETNARLESLLDEQEQWRQPNPVQLEALARADKEIMQLQAALEEAEEETGKIRQELLWQKATQGSLDASVKNLQKELADRETRLEALEKQMELDRLTVEKWKNTVGQMSQVIITAEQRLKDAEARQRAYQSELDAKQEEIRELQAAVAGHTATIDEQNHELADALSELARLELSLQEVRQELADRTKERDQVVEVARKRIKALEEQLEQSRRRR